MRPDSVDISVAVRIRCDKCGGCGLLAAKGSADRVPCNACDGVGYRESWASLAKVLKRIVGDK